MKIVKQPGYNHLFDEKTGLSVRWGDTFDQDPVISPNGPEIADIEITTKCSGPEGKVCKFCYKSNTPNGKNMSFETFKTIFSKLPNTLTQIAFGTDATATANPDMWKIMEHCRHNNIVPNITVANISIPTAYKLSQMCGAVAVSRYDNKDLCYDSVQRLTSFGMQQVNIHQLLAEETFDNVIETIRDIKTDLRLTDLNAIVFLSLKQKGRGTGYTRLSQDKFNYIVKVAMAAGIPFGFDSCSANKFLNSVKNHKQYNKFIVNTEPCESTCFSLYVNVEGEYFPCSFTEGGSFDNAGNWTRGIPLNEVVDFKTELWENYKTRQFRKSLLSNVDDNGVRGCPLYEI